MPRLLRRLDAPRPRFSRRARRAKAGSVLETDIIHREHVHGMLRRSVKVGSGEGEIGNTRRSRSASSSTRSRFSEFR